MRSMVPHRMMLYPSTSRYGMENLYSIRGVPWVSRSGGPNLYTKSNLTAHIISLSKGALYLVDSSAHMVMADLVSPSPLASTNL